MRKSALVLLTVLGACATPRASQDEAIVCGQDDEAAVWQSALVAEAAHSAYQKDIILESPTKLGLLHPAAREITEPFRGRDVEIPEQLVAQFLAANQYSVDLTKVCKSNRRFRTITSAEAKAAFLGSDPEARWAAFYKKHNHAAGLFALSRAGFYRDLALVHIEYGCGGECGHGHLFLLRRTGGIWILQAQAVTWLS